jgi:CHASE2 domain-containing sensor protein
LFGHNIPYLIVVFVISPRLRQTPKQPGSRAVWDFPEAIHATSFPNCKEKNGRAKNAVFPPILFYTDAQRTSSHATVKFKAVIEAKWFKPAVGAALTALCGLLLWGTPLGEAWENASYDYLFLFSERAVTNKVALILMDTASYEELKQLRGKPWAREKHTQLLNQLADDGCPLAVFDVFFRSTNNPDTDAALAEAMRRHGGVVLMADVADPQHPGLDSSHVLPPQPLFVNSATNYGVGHVDADTGGTARRHWPFFAPGEGEFRSLAWAAAESAGAQLNPKSEQQWLRYYRATGPWETFSYHLAPKQPKKYFCDKIVFIGNDPEKKSDPGSPEKDKFRTPYTRWNGPSVGGVEILATEFLNLMNNDWLRRPASWVEALLLVVTGVLIGGTLCRFRPLRSCLVAAAIALVVMLVFVSWSYFTNYWFPWLVIAGGQVPCAVAWTLLAPKRQPQNIWAEGKFPGYEVIGEPFGEGAYGKVWLVRNATGQLQALKEIERSKFNDDGPYDREFRGIKNYKPISNQHPGLLHIDHVNRNDRAGYFYYVMELGDPLDADWEQRGASFKPRDLASVYSQAEGRRLSAGECVRIGIALLEAIDFLHQQGLVHRDIKPQNIIFVNGLPKLADVGLVREASQDATWVGTEFYMPPEPPGTASADIYALGKVLYVISTGKHPRSFSELSTTLVERPEFMRLNDIICKACQPASEQRYATAAEMLAALRAAQEEFIAGQTRRI